MHQHPSAQNITSHTDTFKMAPVCVASCLSPLSLFVLLLLIALIIQKVNPLLANGRQTVLVLQPLINLNFDVELSGFRFTCARSMTHHRMIGIVSLRVESAAGLLTLQHRSFGSGVYNILTIRALQPFTQIT